ncbi:hypothetical protein C4572_02185 [Candidatus Parcubacteria bacterium]|nr:MAG: hypothetical protein C4572_02185 [Candidatus Parcubacteria bacterium]
MKRLNGAFIASGGGTDFSASMIGKKGGKTDLVDFTLLVSTNPDAGCIAKGRLFPELEVIVIDAKKLGKKRFQNALDKALRKRGIDILVMVGNIHKVKTKNVPYVVVNIHPANKDRHGGNGMYDLETHMHVLRDILDQLKRGTIKLTDRIVTEINFHIATEEHDRGPLLVAVYVPIPFSLIENLINCGSLKYAARCLQKIVLKREWEILPTAINIAAMEILEKTA